MGEQKFSYRTEWNWADVCNSLIVDDWFSSIIILCVWLLYIFTMVKSTEEEEDFI